MFLRCAYTLRGQVGGGWALEIVSFLGPVKWHWIYRQVPFGKKLKISRAQPPHTCPSNGSARIKSITDRAVYCEGCPKACGKNAKLFFCIFIKSADRIFYLRDDISAHFDLPPPMKKRWYRPRKFSVDERRRFTPPYTWCFTSQRRGSVKILFHTYSIILNTYNPPYEPYILTIF